MSVYPQIIDIKKFYNSKTGRKLNDIFSSYINNSINYQDYHMSSMLGYYYAYRNRLNIQNIDYLVPIEYKDIVKCTTIIDIKNLYELLET